ncbi:hypothetical protein AX14_008938 [Amanita brunnescens Koide BX004]|nr:hypothetical protein AX14_008938 [Amanita brunnescens Koide BX004]
MMPQILSHPSQLDLPKYIPDYSSNHFLPRPRLASVASLFSARPSRPSPDRPDSPEDIVDDDRDSSPNSRPASSGTYHYANRAPDSLLPQVPAQEILNSNAASSVRGSEAPGAYLSSTPSPVEAHSPATYPQPHSAPHSQDRFPHSAPLMGGDRFNNTPQDPMIDQFSRADKYSTGNSQLHGQKRMSEPAILGSTNLYPMPSSDPSLRYSQYDFAFMPASLRSSSNYVPSLQRVSSFDSREVRHEPYSVSSGWKHTLNSHRSLESVGNSSSGVDHHPISPLRPNFSAGLASPVHESHYGPSPPNTGNSVTSNAGFGIGVNPPSSSHSHTGDGDPGNADGTNRTYSFVALPGNAVKKRPRRRYDEIERLYQCSWPNCTKAYGTLNHLNAHVTMQKHGSKRSPSEFKELRKQWRKAKKEAEAAHLVGGSIRRGSISSRYDDPTAYDSARYGHSVHHPHMGMGMSSGHLSHSSANGRYALTADEGRYPVDQRDEHLGGYFGDVNSRPRYGEGASSSWHPAPTRSDAHYPYVPSVSSQHHGTMTQINVHHDQPQSQPPPSSASPRVAPSRLPPNSTLLTPLPGYQTVSMLPPLQTAGEGAYDVYDNESTGRPGTGHASIGPGSGDEFDRRI